MELIKAGISARDTDEQAILPRGVCPKCKYPLASDSHGWLKDYWPPEGSHEHTPRCESDRNFRKYGYCLIPCLMCAGGVTAKRQAQLINDLFGDAHIPFYARDWTFTTFPGSIAAARTVRGFLQDCLAGNEEKRGLYLSGARGLGKTGLAIAALRSLIERGQAGCFISTAELFEKLKQSIDASRRVQAGEHDAASRFEASQGAKLLRLVRDLDWLVLDDLGVEAGSKYEIRELYLILEARMAGGRYTIFTSNLDASGLVQFWHADEAARVIDRLGMYCLALPMQGADYRQRKGAR